MSRVPLTRVPAAVAAVAIVCAVVAFGALVSVQVAALILAGITVAAAVLRMVVPAGRTFTVRRRVIDVMMLLTFALALTYLGLTTPLG